MRAKGVQPTREGGFGYLRGPDGAMIENAQAGTTERFNHVHMYHEHPRCAMEWYVTHLGAKMPAGRGGQGPPPHAPAREFPPKTPWPPPRPPLSPTPSLRPPPPP